MVNFIKQPMVKFILIFSLLVVGWFSLYENIYKIDTFLYNSNTTDGIEKSVSIGLAKYSNFFVSIFGYSPTIDTSTDFVVTSIEGNYNTHGVWIGEPCNGIKVFGLFAIFILAFPGPIKHKLWFIPLGIFIVQTSNAIRIAILTIISSENPSLLDFNHNITFQVIVYGLIFLLWYWWVNKFADLKPLKSANKNTHE